MARRLRRMPLLLPLLWLALLPELCSVATDGLGPGGLLGASSAAAAAAQDAAGPQLAVEPKVACPTSQFHVLWAPAYAEVHHWLGVFQGGRMLYWCYLDGTQQPPAELLPASTGVGLKIGSPGSFTVHYFDTARPVNAGAPVLKESAAAETAVTISSDACFFLGVEPATSCALDPLQVAWRFPAEKVGPGDRIGIFPAAAADAQRAPGAALHWIGAADPEGRRLVRFGRAGRYEARYYFGSAPQTADVVSQPFEVLNASDPTCGDYVGVVESSSNNTPAAAAPGDEPPVPTPASDAALAQTMLVLLPITALGAGKGIRVSDANLGPAPTAGVGVMMWIMLLEDSTGGYRSIVYKGLVRFPQTGRTASPSEPARPAFGRATRTARRRSGFCRGRGS